MLSTEIRLVAHVLWKSEALRVVPWLLFEQGTTLSASDLHNAWATIFNLIPLTQ